MKLVVSTVVWLTADSDESIVLGYKTFQLNPHRHITLGCFRNTHVELIEPGRSQSGKKDLCCRTRYRHHWRGN